MYYFILLFVATQMQQSASRSSSLGSVFVGAQAANQSIAAAEEDNLADFGQTIPILGQMERTDQDFKDGLALDLFSPRNRTLVVTQNKSPLSGKFVTGSSGEPFAALSNYSWIIKTNDSARDLIAKVELPYDPVLVQKMGFDIANTYVGILSGDKTSWSVDESRRNVHVSENKTRVIKLTSLDGEYILLGRQTVDTANIFVQYGFGATRTVNVTGGEGVQEAEFIDGLRLSLISEAPMQINIDLKNGVNDTTISRGMRSLNSFAWAVNTSAPTRRLKQSSISFPINSLLRSSSNGSTPMNMDDLVGARRSLNSSSSTKFEPLPRNSQKVTCKPECQLKVSDLGELDGEYIILMSKKKAEVEEKNIKEHALTSQSPSVSGIQWYWTSVLVGVLYILL